MTPYLGSKPSNHELWGRDLSRANKGIQLYVTPRFKVNIIYIIECTSLKDIA